MKRLLPFVFLAFLTGCAALTSIKNPVTPDRLAVAEAGYGAVLAVAVNYRRACIAHLIGSGCRTIIVLLQPYQAKAQAAIVTARSFVKLGDSVNAITAVIAAEQAVSAFKAVSLSNGVK